MIFFELFFFLKFVELFSLHVGQWIWRNLLSQFMNAV